MDITNIQCPGQICQCRYQRRPCPTALCSLPAQEDCASLASFSPKIQWHFLSAVPALDPSHHPHWIQNDDTIVAGDFVPEQRHSGLSWRGRLDHWGPSPLRAVPASPFQPHQPLLFLRLILCPPAFDGLSQNQSSVHILNGLSRLFVRRVMD